MTQHSAFEGRAGRWMARLFSPPGKRGRLVVFCYHQVLAEKDPMRPGEPSLQEFEADIDRIAAWFNVMSLPEASAAMAAGTLPARAACITFDDGYLNNLELAAPALASRNLPATFFVTSGAIEAGVMWNDLIIDGIAGARGALDMSALGDHAPLADASQTPRQLAQSVLDAIKYLPLVPRWAMAEQFYLANVGGELPRKMMRTEQVAELAGLGFDVGAHTVSHPILAKLDDASAKQEIEESVRWVGNVTGQTPRSFAYPNGRPGTDFESVHVEQTRDAGCEVAVTTEWAVGDGSVDAFRIPRVGPWWRFGRGGLDGLFRVYLRNWLPG